MKDTGRISIAEKRLSGCVDVFYIGGTKNGALIGEAIIINHEGVKEKFRFHLKQHGALLSKSRLLGIQFMELFDSNLYFELAGHANKMAARLSRKIEAMGYAFLSRSTTNPDISCKL